MVKLYVWIAQKLLVVLESGKALGQTDTRLVDFARQYARYGSDERLRTIFRDWLDNDELPEGIPQTLDEIVDLLVKQINNIQQCGNEGDLIDAIVKALSLPYARNVMSGRMLSYLKTSLLLPNEMAQFGDIAATRDLNCVTCGKRLIVGEMATVVSSGARGDFAFSCTTCQKPTYVGCDCCHTAMADKGLIVKMRKGFNCGCAVKKAEAPTVDFIGTEATPPEPPVVANTDRLTNRLRNALVEDRTRPAAGWIGDAWPDVPAPQPTTAAQQIQQNRALIDWARFNAIPGNETPRPARVMEVDPNETE